MLRCQPPNRVSPDTVVIVICSETRRKEHYKPPTKMFLGLNRPILMGKQITRGNRKQYFAKKVY